MSVTHQNTGTNRRFHVKKPFHCCAMRRRDHSLYAIQRHLPKHSVWWWKYNIRRQVFSLAVHQAMNWFVTFLSSQQLVASDSRDALMNQFSHRCQRSFINTQIHHLRCHANWSFLITICKITNIIRRHSNSCWHKAPHAMCFICSHLTQNRWQDRRLCAKPFQRFIQENLCQNRQKFTSKFHIKESHWLTTVVSSSSENITQRRAFLSLA